MQVKSAWPSFRTVQDEGNLVSLTPGGAWEVYVHSISDHLAWPYVIDTANAEDELRLKRFWQSHRQL